MTVPDARGREQRRDDPIGFVRHEHVTRAPMILRFADSYLGQLRAIVGNRPIAMPSVCVIVENGAGEVLLIRRSDMGIWGWPAGSVEIWDSIETTARKELEEEAGILAHALVPIGFSSDPVAERIEYPNGDVLHAFSMIFHVTEWSGIPRPDGLESTDVQFFARDALPPDRLLAVSRELDALERYKETGVFQLI